MTESGIDPMESLESASATMAAMDDPGRWAGWVVYLLESLERRLVVTREMYEVARQREEAEQEQYEAMLLEVSHACLARIRRGGW